MNDNFNTGWQIGFDWIKTNYKVDKAGNINVSGTFLNNFIAIDDRMKGGMQSIKKYVRPNKKVKWVR